MDIPVQIVKDVAVVSRCQRPMYVFLQLTNAERQIAAKKAGVLKMRINFLLVSVILLNYQPVMSECRIVIQFLSSPLGDQLYCRYLWFL